MKKTSILLAMLFMGFASQAQTRLALYEEFTGENCPPCASTNPGLDAILSSATNSVKINPIKWQVAIPSAPSATWSLYQTNITEINNRDTYYNISSAPNGRCDGQSQTVFGASSDHPANWSSTHITNAANVATPFAITMTPTWDATFSTATVVIDIQSSATFTATNLRLRLVLVEKNINFPTAPGTNGEKDFHWPVRKSYPDIANGTALPNSWTASQLQSYTIVCVAPSYIVSKGEMSFVAYLQDDANKKIWQSSRTTTPPIPNEAQAISANVNNVSCATSITPTVTVKNNGINAITAMTIMPNMNSVNGTPVVWTGNLAVGATTNIVMGSENTINGNNTYSYTITDVSGGDVVTSNNGTSKKFFNNTVYTANPPVEGFTNASWPYANWGIFNNNGAPHTWLRNAVAGGFMTSTESIRLFINWTPVGGTHDLYMPGVSFTGSVAPGLKFDLSYCQLATGDNDRLEVNVSTDCGQSWTTAWINQGNSMATAPPNNQVLNTPSVAAQWSLVTVPLTTYSNAASVLIRFKATSDQGNSIWLDNINLVSNVTAGVAEAKKTETEFGVFPNPASNEVNLTVNAPSSQSADVKIINALGQVVIAKNVSLNAGYNTIQIDTKELASGIYYVSCGNATKKLTITK